MKEKRRKGDKKAFFFFYFFPSFFSRPGGIEILFLIHFNHRFNHTQR